MSPLAEEPPVLTTSVGTTALEEAPAGAEISSGRRALLSPQTSLSWDRCILDEEGFHRAIALERRRTERSHKPFLLMLLDVGDCLKTAGEEVSEEILSILSLAARETDVVGWYEGDMVGVMFTEITLEDRGAILQVMMDRVCDSLRDNLSSELFQRIRITVHLFPEEWKQDLPHAPCDTRLYPDLARRERTKRIFTSIKRGMDIVGAGLALLVLSPVFLMLAAAIKLTSKGPVFFRQQRVGQFGQSFMVLKLRSMYVGNDPTIHQQYVKKLIAAGTDKKKPGRKRCIQTHQRSTYYPHRPFSAQDQPG